MAVAVCVLTKMDIAQIPPGIHNRKLKIVSVRKKMPFEMVSKSILMPMQITSKVLLLLKI